MKYFIDTEFIESFHKPFLGKKRHFIDLISIGIVCEDGRSLYRISNEFNPKDANDWVKDNVISKLEKNYMNLKSNKDIATDIKEFMGFRPEFTDYGSDEFSDDRNIEIYAYYADYDWVVFCSLFGRMIDLPKGMPMYCRDLKQSMDEAIKKWSPEGNLNNPELISCFKNREGFPKQENEHNALDDAKWNKALYNYLKSLNGNN